MPSSGSMTQASRPDKESCSYLLAADPPNVPERPLKHVCVSAICRKLSAEMAWNKVYIDFGIVPNILRIVAAGPLVGCKPHYATIPRCWRSAAPKAEPRTWSNRSNQRNLSHNQLQFLSFFGWTWKKLPLARAAFSNSPKELKKALYASERAAPEVGSAVSDAAARGTHRAIGRLPSSCCFPSRGCVAAGPHKL